MQIKFDHEQYVKDLQISSADLETELCNNPARLGFYIAQAAHWTRVFDNAKSQKETRASSVYFEQKNGPNKVTDKGIEAAIQLDAEYQQLEKQMFLAKEQCKLYEGAVNALDKKQYSLGSLNSRNKMELEHTAGNTGTRVSSEERTARRERLLDAQG